MNKIISLTCLLIAGVRDYHKSGSVPEKQGGRRTSMTALGMSRSVGSNRRDHISRRQLVRYDPATSFTGEIIPLFPKPLYSTQLTSVTCSCTEVQKLFPLVPSHPALSGHINPVTSGTKKKCNRPKVIFLCHKCRGAREYSGWKNVRRRAVCTWPLGSRASSQDRPPTLLPLTETETSLPVVGVCQARGSLCLYIFYC